MSRKGAHFPDVYLECVWCKIKIRFNNPKHWPRVFERYYPTAVIFPKIEEIKIAVLGETSKFEYIKIKVYCGTFHCSTCLSP